jgi:hypothetical protein
MKGVETADRNREPGRSTDGAIRRDVRLPDRCRRVRTSLQRCPHPVSEAISGLRRYTRSHEPAVVIGEPSYMVVMLDWDDMAALEAALGSEVGQRTAEDAAANLARYGTFRGMILQLDEV